MPIAPTSRRRAFWTMWRPRVATTRPSTTATSPYESGRAWPKRSRVNSVDRQGSCSVFAVTPGHEKISCRASTSVGSVARILISDTQRLAREQPVMRHRPVAAAKRERSADRLGDVVLRVLHRLHDVTAVGESGSDRRRQRAAGAMRVQRVDPFGLKCVERPTVKQHVRGVTRAMATLHDYRAWAEIDNRPRRLVDVLYRRERTADEHFGFRQIGRHYQRQRQEIADQRRDRVRLEQAIAALGNHHRIDYDAIEAPTTNALGHRGDDLSAGQHARLGRVHADVLD